MLDSLDTAGVKKALPNYRKILLGKAKPKFQTNKDKLDQRIKTASKIIESCELCERKCKVNRTKEQKGWCQILDKPIISSVFEHYGEEKFITPSFTIFFWSCTFTCQYCQNWTISQRIEPGIIADEKELAKQVDQHSNCRNVNFVGGSPTPHLPFILKIIKNIKSNIPVIWNSNFYMSEKSMNLLKGLVDVYLSDWKYWSNDCALRLSKASNYLEIIKRNHNLAFKDAELVIRHLVLPNHFECCTKPILKYIAKTFRDNVIVNIMDQYRPHYKASEYPDINKSITKEEFNKVIKLAKKLDLNFVT